MVVNYHSKCRVCGNEQLEDVLNLGDHYLHGLFCFEGYNPPMRKIPTELVRCETKNGGCGLVQRRHSVDSDILYNRYGYRSSVTESMRAHLKGLVNDLLSIKTPESVLEIGGNDGYLIKQYPDNVRKVVVDPCDVVNSIEGVKNLVTINECFPTKKLGGDKFDIITFLACYYDLNSPVEAAHEIKNHLKDGGIAVIEVSYWPEKMLKVAIDEVCDEHVAFYNYQNLEHIFSKAGLKIFDVKRNQINGGSIQIWMTHEYSNVYLVNKQAIFDIKKFEFDLMLDTEYPYETFKHKAATLKDQIRYLFRNEIKFKGKTCHLLGASTKGNVLLNFFGLDYNDIPYASERSKEKIGGKTLGTNIKMISEEESRAMKPDYYFVPIWGFRDEVLKREKDYIMNGGSLIFPIPKLEIINKDNYND